MTRIALAALLLCGVAAAEDDPLASVEAQLGKAHPASASIPRYGPTTPSAAHPRSDRTHLHPEPHEHPEPHVHTAHAWHDAFRLPFMQRALLTGLMAGAVCSWLGVFVILRRLVFAAIALAQVASAGIGLAVFMGWNPAAAGMVAAVLASVASSNSRIRKQLPGEAYMGIVYVAAASVAILLLAQSGTGEAEQLELLHGNLLIVSDARLTLLALVAASTLIFHLLGFNRLIAIAFDPVTETVAGSRVWLWDFCYFLLLGLGIGVAIQNCGLLLVFGYLIVPASAGFLAGVRFPGVLLIATICHSVSTALGLWTAYELDLPAGPAVVAAMVACLPLTAAIRGLRLLRALLPPPAGT